MLGGAKGKCCRVLASPVAQMVLKSWELDFGHLMESCGNKWEFVWEFMGIHRSSCKFMIIIWGYLWETQGCALPQ